MNLTLHGISFKSAPLEIREKFALSQDEIPIVTKAIAALEEIHETIVLSTCNRTEIYTVSPSLLSPNKITEILHEFKKINEIPARYFYTLRGRELIGHLFRVASGLESQMVGENQIKGQLKEAFETAKRVGSIGTCLDRLCSKAFQTGKRVRSMTALGTGAISLSGAAVELAGRIYENLEKKSALLIGAGETAELVAKHLLKRGLSSLKIANRTKEKAAILAGEYRGEVVEFESLANHLFTTDIVISATSTPGYLLYYDALAEAPKRSKPTLIIDIAVPRDIDPAIGTLENVFLYDMDDLKTIVEKNLEERKSEIPRAEAIIEKAVLVFEEWLSNHRGGEGMPTPAVVIPSRVS